MMILVDVQEEPHYRNPLKGVDANIIIGRLEDAITDEVIESMPGQLWVGYTLRGKNLLGSLRCYLDSGLG